MYYFGIANKIDGFMGSTAGNIFIYLQMGSSVWVEDQTRTHIFDGRSVCLQSLKQLSYSSCSFKNSMSCVSRVEVAEHVLVKRSKQGR